RPDTTLFPYTTLFRSVLYRAQNNDASIIFNEIREDDKTINRISKFLKSQNERKTSQLNSVIEYATDHKVCKSVFLLQYFGEKKRSEEHTSELQSRENL